MNKSILSFKYALSVLAVTLVCLLSSVIAMSGAWFVTNGQASVVITAGNAVTYTSSATLSGNHTILPSQSINLDEVNVTVDSDSSNLYLRAYVVLAGALSNYLTVNHTIGSGWMLASDGYYYYVGSDVSEITSTTTFASLQELTQNQTTTGFQLSVTMNEDAEQDELNDYSTLNYSIVFQSIQSFKTSSLVLLSNNSAWGTFASPYQANITVDGLESSFVFQPGDTIANVYASYNAAYGTNLSDETTCGWFYDSELTQSVTDYNTEITTATKLYTKTATLNLFEFTMSSDSSKYYISKNSSTAGDVVIPAIHQGLPVEISTATESTDGAFYNCSGITSFTLSNSITSISDYAFYNCSNISTLAIPTGVSSIKNIAFYGCSSLASLSLSKNNSSYSVDAGVLFNKRQTQLIYYPVAKTSTSYSIPSTVTSMSSYAFTNAINLNAVAILGKMTTIPTGAFSNCTSLTNIQINSAVLYINDSAFLNCTSLSVINYDGTKAQWNRTSIGSNNTDLIEATIYYGILWA